MDKFGILGTEDGEKVGKYLILGTKQPTGTAQNDEDENCEEAMEDAESDSNNVAKYDRRGVFRLLRVISL